MERKRSASFFKWFCVDVFNKLRDSKEFTNIFLPESDLATALASQKEGPGFDPWTVWPLCVEFACFSLFLDGFPPIPPPSTQNLQTRFILQQVTLTDVKIGP